MFAAPSACAQGPFEVDVPADGTTAVDGIALVACTPRRLVGHAEIWIGSTAEMSSFGDVADNARCVGGSGTAVIATAGSATSVGGDASTGSAAPAAAALVKQTFSGSDADDESSICARYGGSAQEIADYHVTRTSAEIRVEPGEPMTVRFWSAEPNDLAGVVFLIRHVTSTKPPKQLSKDEAAKLARDRAAENQRAFAEQPHRAPVAPQPTETPWRAPPQPLAEVQPDRPNEAATWVAGYWKWTGAAYGWVAGFWRDAADMPAPQVESPGAAPHGAIWIGGAWRRSGGGWVWIGGRWRSR
ncbi:MAG TPA: YXWGXW repeat-containing protein [Kofleriaceae bacterium]|nr:YXWGXW repeat-containing protein [Kofleriaceae bacterium]